MSNRSTRRQFLQRAAVAGSAAAAYGVFSSRSIAESKSPNEKLNIAAIGTANQANYDIENVQSENFVALCDVDDVYLEKAAKRFPQAKRYNDFRKLLEQKDIDAVVIATPDHTHAPATYGALSLGKHVYCEKPLTHTVSEARMVAELAKKQKVATQMGTQIHAGANYRRVVELVQSGAIGKIGEVHVWVGKSYTGNGRPKETPPVPATLNWDLWLGPAPERPYHPAYVPFNWRSWWDFGGGTLADMACHFMDLPFWALSLRHPKTIAAEGPPVHAENCPSGLTVRYEFPARGEQPPVKLTWYDGDRIPKMLHDKPMPGSGVLFVGEKGQMFADYGSYKLYPEAEFATFKPPAETIPASVGHHREWIVACKTGSPTTCNFDYSGALTEAVLLGNVSYRVGKALEWDADSLKAINCPEADKYVKHEYRQGWTL